MTDQQAPKTAPDLGNAMREAQIAQMLNGLRSMPAMRMSLQGMADRGDDVAKEVLARFDAEK